jgi:hypothetical protein
VIEGRIRFESWHDGLFSLVCHNIKHMVDIGICKARQNVGIMAFMRFILLFLFLRSGFVIPKMLRDILLGTIACGL